MALNPYYSSGTVSVAAGGTVVTGTGTSWLGALTSDFSYEFVKSGYSIPIQSIDSNTQVTLAEPWPGTILTNATYRIRFLNPGSALAASVRAAIDGLSNLGLPGSGVSDLQLILNKATAANIASILLKDAQSGRAEMGLTGDDDFHVKVSPDGAAWYEALKIARAGGAMTLPAGQLQFPATQNPSADANTLDDYEEGTFTPILTTNVTPPSGWTASAAVGEYVKIGTFVYVTVRLLLTSKGTGGSGNSRIGGLPFAVRSTANQTTEASPRLSNVTLTAGYTFVIAGFNPGTATGGFLQIGSGMPAAGFAWDTSLADNSELGITGCYLT